MAKHKVITHNLYGGKSKFTNKELQEMIDNPMLYYGADNLPKWIASRDTIKKGYGYGYDRYYKLVIRRIRHWIKMDKTVVIKFLSDDEYKITFIK